MIAVIGGGVAGCAAARALAAQGHPVTIFESGTKVGGRAMTVEHDGYSIDSGAVYLLTIYNRALANLEQDSGVESLRHWSPIGGLYNGQRSEQVRYDFLPSFLGLPSFSLADKFRLARKGLGCILGGAPSPYVTDSCAQWDDGQTIDQWSRHEFGDNIHETLVRPWIEPAFGVGCEQLSTPFLRGVLKSAHKAKFRVPIRGMGDIAQTFARNAQVHVSTPVTAVTNRPGGHRIHTKDGAVDADAVIVATDAVVASQLLRDVIPSKLCEEIATAPYSTMVHLAIGWEQNPWPNTPYHLMLPVGAGKHPIVGIILHGCKAPHAIPKDAQVVNVYCRHEFSLKATDDELRREALKTIQAMLGPAPAPSFIDIHRWPRALALAPPGHYAARARIRDAMPPTIRLAGDHLAHLGVETAVVTGEHAARDVHAALIRR